MARGTVQPPAVLFRAEDADFAVLAAERLAAFENRLAVMECIGRDAYGDVIGAGKRTVIPLPVRVMEPDVAPGRHEFESEIFPVDVHDQMPSRLHVSRIRGKYSRVQA